MHRETGLSYDVGVVVEEAGPGAPRYETNSTVGPPSVAHLQSHDGVSYDEGRKRHRQDDDTGAHIVSRLKRVHLGSAEAHQNTLYVVVNKMLKEAHEDMMRRKYDTARDS